MTGTAQKLTPDDIQDIIKMIDQGLKQRYIAAVKNVKQPLISQIKNGKIWKSLRAQQGSPYS